MIVVKSWLESSMFYRAEDPFTTVQKSFQWTLDMLPFWSDHLALKIAITIDGSKKRYVIYYCSSCTTK